MLLGECVSSTFQFLMELVKTTLSPSSDQQQAGRASYRPANSHRSGDRGEGSRSSSMEEKHILHQVSTFQPVCTWACPGPVDHLQQLRAPAGVQVVELKAEGLAVGPPHLALQVHQPAAVWAQPGGRHGAASPPGQTLWKKGGGLLGGVTFYQ